MVKPVESCLQIITKAKQEVNKLLTGTEHTNNLLEINSHFQRLEAKMRFMGAVTEPELNGKSKEEMFPPITNFMGKKIEVSKRVDRTQLKPKEDEKNKFRQDVQKLYDTIIDMEPSQVLNAHKLPEHIMIVRGVAKIAGVEDFDTKEMNVPFIEEIQLAVEMKGEQEVAQTKIDKAAGKKPVNTVELTQEIIDADVNLQKMQAKPGDHAITAADGTVTLKRKDKK